MITLSYSTINLIYNSPHCYLNKIMGIKQPDNKYFIEGKRIHRIIQDHVAGIKLDDRLEHIKEKFPIVEVVDFDPKCAIEFKVDMKYKMRGFVDGLDKDNKRTLEIKTGKIWSLGEFQKAIQRKIYAIGLPYIKENYLITASSDDSSWDVNKPKIYSLPVTKQDTIDGWKWIHEGIRRLEHIKEFVDEELESTGGNCIDPRCYWGINCQFK